jgi:signal transduction histidine kinase/ligand-binding sensor domain-containing protein/DNA-binding response OmpR family regulator
MGLSSNSQRCITQDKEGFIWIGTGDGLNRFDGYNFKVYRNDPNDPTSLKSNIIDCLFVDRKGNLWVGTYGGGLNRYNKDKDNFVSYKSDIYNPSAPSNEGIKTIAEDKYDRLWIGTSNGLFMLDSQNKFVCFRLPDGKQPDSKTIAYNEINKIVFDNDILWIAYSHGILSALNTSDMTFKHYKLFDIYSQHTADFSINSLILDKNNIWFSSWSKGIWIFDKTTGKCRPYEKEKSQYINFLYKDDKNRLWYSPESKGLVLVDGDKKFNYQVDDYDSNTLSSNLLSNIIQDRQGNLWVTSKQGDLNYIILDNPFYKWYRNPSLVNGLTYNLVTSVIEDSKRRIWVGYDEGSIDILDSQNIRPKIHIKGDNSTGLGPGPVMFIYESNDGSIWIGKYLDGLKKYNEKTKVFSSFQHVENNEESIAGNDIRHIDEDSKGNFWITIHGAGIDKFNPKTGKFIHHRKDWANPAKTIYSDWTFTSLCDKNDNIWICTIDGVTVLSAKDEILKHYTTEEKDGFNLSSSMALIVFIDSRNYVWIGTADGLNKIDRKNNSIKKYFSKDGLPSNLIIDIMEDDHYNLWISTDKGLSKFSPEKDSFINYSVKDGLATDEFNKFASFKNREGEMYFGGRGGLSRFYPDNIRINNYIPPVYITDFKLFNQSVKIKKDDTAIGFSIPKQIIYTKEISLEHDQNVITLEYAALNYLNLENNQYKYMLVGFDNKWISAGHKRDVTYLNLDPGEYVFRVIASNNDDIWNNEGASLRIIIKPPFWKTRWAYAFYSLFVIFLLYLFRKWILYQAEIKRKLEYEELEIQKLHELDVFKMQFFSNISHEFRTPLTLIVGPIGKLINDAKDEIQKNQLKLVQRNANRLLRLINQMMDYRKIEVAKLELNITKNNIVHFVKEIIELFNQDAKQRNIYFTFDCSYESFEVLFDTDKLEKVVYNLLSNAFKYTPDNGRIVVTMSFNLDGKSVGNDKKYSNPLLTGKTLKISVKDTGIGIPKEELSKIFDRFYQVKNSVTTMGTGIGLSLAYELVILHKGEIIVESEPNIGSEFTVVLPLWLNQTELPALSLMNARVNDDGNEIVPDENLEPSDQSVEKMKISDKYPKVLVVEDDTDMRLFICSELREKFNIVEAHNGMVALDKSFQEIPDAVICDVMMPGMTGYEVCRTLKHDERTSHIPVILLTAKSSEQHTIEGLESGADDYITKPFSVAILKARIKNLIESRVLLRKKFVKEPFAPIKEVLPSKTDEKLFNKAYSIVEKNLNNTDFDVNDFASEIGMSRTQLYRKIHAISGQSVKEFIRIIRLKKAAEMLQTSESNISEIAYTVGFNSLSYFTTSFTEYFRMNPSKYIEKYRI